MHLLKSDPGFIEILRVFSATQSRTGSVTVPATHENRWQLLFGILLSEESTSLGINGKSPSRRLGLSRQFSFEIVLAANNRIQSDDYFVLDGAQTAC